MIAAFSLLLHLGILIIKLHVKAILFLVRRFEITNGLVSGFVFHILTASIHINVWVRIAVIISIICGSIVLQYFFKPARIVYGVLGSAFAGVIAYAVFQNSTWMNPCIPSAIVIILAGIINFLGWRLRACHYDSEKD